MTVFWLLIAAMTALALVFIVPPLLRNKSTRHIDHDGITTAVIKQQLAELGSDLEAGKLDQAAYSAARHDLERALLDDLNEPADPNHATVQHSSRWSSAVLALAVPVTALWLYHQLGSEAALSPEAQTTPQVAANGAGHSLEEMINKLASELQENPDNIEGWIMLATSYASTDQFDKAVKAYQEALKRTGDHPRLLTDYADALAMARGGEFTDEVGELLEKALQLQPDNVKALWLLGHWHYQRSQYDATLKLWQKAAQYLQADSQDATILNQQINQVRNKLGMPASKTVTVAQTKPATTAASSIQVNVSLDPSLKDRSSPQDTLFIFARAVKGPRMPLAIVRKQVKDLPVTVTLDDSQAMSPQMVLSKFPQVSIGARISKTGNAMPSSGDLMGNVSPVSTSDKQSVEVVISEAVP